MQRRLAAGAGALALTAVLGAVIPSAADAPEVRRAAPVVEVAVLGDWLSDEPVVPATETAAPLPPPASAAVAPDLAALAADDGEVPVRAAQAYRAAAKAVGGCRLRWEVVAAIGRIESDHGRHGDGALHEDGRVLPPVLGPRLDGAGPFARIVDTDDGRLDGDLEYDRAVGPMQFIPSTWARWASDGDGDGVHDPHDLDDAARAAARYLCASGRRLDQPPALIAAVFSYNHSYDYVRAVLTVAARYAGVDPVSLGTGLLPPPTVPTPSPTPTPEAPTPEPAPVPGEQPGATPGGTSGAAPTPTSTGTGTGTDGPTPSDSPTPTPTESEPTEVPTDPPTDPAPDPTDPVDLPGTDPPA